MPGLKYSGDIAAGVFRIRGNIWKHIASTNAAQMANTEQSIGDLKRETEQETHDYEGSITQGEDRANFGRLRPLLERYYQAGKACFREPRIENTEAYQKYMAEADPAYEALSAHLLVMMKWNSQYGSKAAAAAQGTVESARTLTWMMMGLVLCWEEASRMS